MNAPPSGLLRFVKELPPQASPHIRWDYCAILKALQAREGEWAQVGATMSHGQASYLAMRLRCLGAEAQRRGRPKQESVVFARWTGVPRCS